MRKLSVCLFYGLCVFTIVFSLFWMALPKLPLSQSPAGSETDPASPLSLAAQAVPQTNTARYCLQDSGGRVAVYIFKKQIDQLHPALSWLATFAFINVTWVYFRAASVSEANLFLRQILHLNLAPIQKAAMDVFVLPEFDFIFQLFHTSRPLLLMAAFFAFALFAILGMKNTNERMNRFRPSAPLSLVTAVLLVWSILSFGGISTFLYINF